MHEWLPLGQQKLGQKNWTEFRPTRGPNLLLFGYWRGQPPPREPPPMFEPTEHLAAPICIQLNRLS